MKSLTILVCVTLTNICACLKLPSSFTKCDRKQSDFNQCLPKAIEDATRQLISPLPEFSLPSVDPMEIESLTIGSGKGVVHLQQNYNKVKVYGGSKVNVLRAEMNFETKTLLVECNFPEMRMEFQYEINGKLLIMPVHGRGPGSVVLDELNNLITFVFQEYEKEGEEYLKVVDTKLVMTPELIKSNFENLFNGNKRLGDNINKMMNENWRVVFSDVGPSYEEAFAGIFQSIFNNFLEKVPASEIF